MHSPSLQSVLISAAEPPSVLHPPFCPAGALPARPRSRSILDAYRVKKLDDQYNLQRVFNEAPLKMTSLSPTIVLLLVTFCIIVAISAGVLLFSATRPQTQSDYTRDLQVYQEQQASRRNAFTFTYNPRSGGYNWKRWNGDSTFPVSESMVTIQISPSKPTIFGDEKDESAVKVTLTPPTPAKKERRAVLNDVA